MKKHRLLNVLIALFAAMVLTPITAWGITGKGTENDPYLITTEAELRELVDIVNGTNGKTRFTGPYVELISDIALTSEWTAMGSNNYPFTGWFNGNNNTISGLKLTAQSANAGFFGCVNGGTIKNFTLAGSISSAYDNTGSVVGYAKGKTKIQDVESHVNITMTASKSHLGGIVGNIENATSVEGCTYHGTLDANASTDSNGGIVGFANANCSGNITNCFFNGTVKTTGSNPQMGGILGYMNDTNNNFGGVKYCYSCGTLKYNGKDTYANAIIGRIRAHSRTIVNNYFLSGTAKRACNTDCDEKVDFSKNIAISISVTAQNGGKVTQNYINPTSTTVTKLQVVAVPNNGYHYDNWNDGGAKTHSVELLDNITLTASFGTFSEEASWTWDKDCKRATCTRTCTNDPNHKSERTVKINEGITAKEKKAPTCLTWGINIYTAQAEVEGTLYTDSKEIDDISSLGHRFGKEHYVEPTCTTTGTKKYWICERPCCEGLYYTTNTSYNQSIYENLADTLLPAKEHDFSKQEASDFYLCTPATCTEWATYYHKCRNCDAKGTTTWTKYFSEIGHDFSAEVYDEELLKNEATCTTGKTYYRKCSRCDVISNYTWEKPNSELGHDFSVKTKEIAFLKTPPCYEDAVYYHKCSRCGEKSTTTWTETGTAGNHQPEVEFLLNPSAEDKGNWVIKDWTVVCSENVIHFASNASLATQTVAVDPTEYNQITVSCDYQIIKPGNNRIGKAIIYVELLDENNTLLDTKWLLNWSGINREMDDKEHVSAVVSLPVNTHYVRMVVSGNDQVSDEGTNGPIFSNMSMKGHNIISHKVETCLEKGAGGYICIACGKEVEQFEIDALGHEWSEYAIKNEPNCTDEGTKTRYCLHEGCSETEKESIPALGHKYNKIDDIFNTKEAEREGWWVSNNCIIRGKDYFQFGYEEGKVRRKAMVDRTQHDYVIVSFDYQIIKAGFDEGYAKVCIELLDKDQNVLDSIWVLDWSGTNYEMESKKNVSTIIPLPKEAGYVRWSIMAIDQWHSFARGSLGPIFSNMTISVPNFTIQKEATCIEEGTGHYTCLECGITGESVVISALGHRFVDEYCTNCGLEKYKVDEVETLRQLILMGKWTDDQLQRYDINADGEINIVDVALLIEILNN